MRQVCLLVICILLLFIQLPDERNYHIFYCLLVGLGASEKENLELTEAKDYYYLTQVRDNSILCRLNVTRKVRLQYLDKPEDRQRKRKTVTLDKRFCNLSWGRGFVNIYLKYDDFALYT